MRFVVTPLILVSLLFLSACNSGPGEDEFAPKIGEINTQIIHLHSSINSDKPEGEQQTIGVSIRATITDPDGLGNIQTVYIYDQNNDSYWTLKDRGELKEDRGCQYLEDGFIMECTFYPDDYTDSIELSGYTLVAVDLHRYQTEQLFEFKLPGGLDREFEEFVYDADYSGGTANGVAALEAMSQVDNGLTASIETEVLTNPDRTVHKLRVSFEVNDSRAKAYSMTLYDDASPRNIVGNVAYSAAAVQAATIAEGEATIVFVPEAQITFTGNNDINSIKAVKVRLYDDPVASNQLEVQSNWFNYRSDSEVVSLTE